MSFSQIFDRFSRYIGSEVVDVFSARNADRQLQRAIELIEQERRAEQERLRKSREVPPEELEYRRACQLLGVDPAETTDQISRRYRAEMMKCHPDLVRDKTSVEIRSATLRAQQLNQAFDCILKFRERP